jgi:hypothetical protein
MFEATPKYVPWIPKTKRPSKAKHLVRCSLR